MNDNYPVLAKPPIVEAVLDFDCDVPPTGDLKSMGEAARPVFQNQYPEVQPRYLQEVRVSTGQDGGFDSSLQRSLQAWMFRSADKKQLVQIRQSGFSFNRLAPYCGFDACLPEIRRVWTSYCELVRPISVLTLRLRYINRILLPMEEVNHSGPAHYLEVQAALPDGAGLVPSGFLNQYQATDDETGFQAAVVLASQSVQDKALPVTFDNTVLANGEWDPFDWAGLETVIKSLRELKNRIFFRTVTPSCLELFQ